MIARLDRYGDPCEEDHSGEVGCHGEGIYCEGGICTDGNEGKNFNIEVSRKGKCEGLPEGVEVEKGGASTGGSEDQ